MKCSGGDPAISHASVNRSPSEPPIRLIVSIDEPYALADYLHGAYYDAAVVKRLPNMWVLALDPPIEYSGVKITQLYASRRYEGTSLTDLVKAGLAIVNLQPVEDTLRASSVVEWQQTALSGQSRDAVPSMIGALRVEGEIPRPARPRGINYYATKSDYLALAGLDEAASMTYMRTTHYRDVAGPVFTRLLELPDLGTSKTGDWNDPRHRYWVLSRDQPLPTLKLAGPNGGSSEIPSPFGGVELRLSGMYRDEALIAGCVAVASSTVEVVQLFELLSTQIKNTFTRVCECWVGPSALALYQSGLRLTTSVTSLTSFDLAGSAATTNE